MAISFTSWTSGTWNGEAITLTWTLAGIRGWPAYPYLCALWTALKERTEAAQAMLPDGYSGTFDLDEPEQDMPVTDAWCDDFNDAIQAIDGYFVDHTDESGDWDGTDDAPPPWTWSTLLANCTTTSRISTSPRMPITAEWVLQSYEILDQLRWTFSTKTGTSLLTSSYNNFYLWWESRAVYANHDDAYEWDLSNLSYSGTGAPLVGTTVSGPTPAGNWQLPDDYNDTIVAYWGSAPTVTNTHSQCSIPEYGAYFGAYKHPTSTHDAFLMSGKHRFFLRSRPVHDTMDCAADFYAKSANGMYTPFEAGGYSSPIDWSVGWGRHVCTDTLVTAGNYTTFGPFPSVTTTDPFPAQATWGAASPAAPSAGYYTAINQVTAIYKWNITDGFKMVSATV